MCKKCCNEEDISGWSYFHFLYDCKPSTSNSISVLLTDVRVCTQSSYPVPQAKRYQPFKYTDPKAAQFFFNSKTTTIAKHVYWLHNVISLLYSSCAKHFRSDKYLWNYTREKCRKWEVLYITSPLFLPDFYKNTN